MRRPRTSVLAGVVLAAAAALLSGCSAGANATPIKPYAPSDGVNANSGSIRVLNALVVAPQTGDAGVVVMVVVNRGTRPDRLVSIESDAGTVRYTGPHALPPGQAVDFGANSNPSAIIEGLTRKPGQAITLRLTFANAEPINLETLVVPATGYYATVTPPAAPTPTPSPSGTVSGPATPSGSESPAPINSPSPTSS